MNLTFAQLEAIIANMTPAEKNLNIENYPLIYQDNYFLITLDIATTPNSQHNTP